jgi:hypothetical protein
MNTQLKYMPVFRLRQEEQKVLTSFYFGDSIYPCIEIIKEIDRVAPTTRKGKKLPPKPAKTFEQIHVPILSKIPSKKIFVDLPVQMKEGKLVRPEVISFLRTVIYKRDQRTKYLLKLSSIANKIIPVVSTYSQKTGEVNSIILQEKDLRSTFKSIAFRTFPNTLLNDLEQIQKIVQEQDFLIVDLQDYIADPTDDDIIHILESLDKFKKCHIIILRSAMDEKITNIGLEHGKSVYEADNRLLKTYKLLKGHSFGDYAGIKKDKVNKGGGISPGFVFYNPIDNKFYGFKGSLNEEGKSNQELSDFETIIIPDVCKCMAVKEMRESGLPFLSINNRGWNMIEDIFYHRDTGKSMAKFKRISMEHYLHCIRTKIDAAHFD